MTFNRRAGRGSNSACASLTRVAAAIWILAALGTSGHDLARAQEAPNADQVQKALESRRGELQSALTRAGEIEKDVAQLDRERAELNKQLLESAALVQASEAKLNEKEDKLQSLEAREQLVRGSLAQRHGQIANLLSALQRMGRNPPPVIVTNREDALAMVRSAILLSAAFPSMRTQALALAQDLDNLVQVVSGIRAERDALKSETQRLGDLRTRLASLMETKHQSITERQAELGRVREAAKDISKSVADLNELIQKLDKTVKENTGLQAYDAEVATKGAGNGQGPITAGASSSEGVTEAPALADGSKPVDVAALTPGQPLRPSVVELAPAPGAVVPGNTGRLKPAIEFNLAKAKLPLPATGRRVLAFGERTQYGSTSKGMVLETRSGAQVTSPCDGWVLYAGEFRSYGKLLIINAGGGYHIVLAGLSQIDVAPGQFVLAAEPVGTMGRSEQSGGAETASGAPVLYIEFRKDGQPVNPDPWWVAGHQKAQG